MMNGITIIMEVLVAVIAFCVLSWALLVHCNKPRVKMPELVNLVL